MKAHVKTPLVSIPQAFQTLLADDYRIGQADMPAPLRWTFGLQMLAAAVGGVLYIFSAEDANKRYLSMTSGMPYLSWMFIFHLPNIGGCVTNFLFNAESYQTVFKNMPRSSKTVERLTDVSASKHYFLWVVAYLASIGTILPTWFVALSGDKWEQTTATLSALANCPVNADGAKSLMEWVGSFNCKQRSATPECNALIKARNIIVAQLERRADKIPLLAGTNEFNGCFDAGDSLASFSAVLSIDVRDFQVPRQGGRVFNATLKFSMFVLLVIGIFQNYGGSYDSYQAGAGASNSEDTEVSVGLLAVIANTLPALGFTFKGLYTGWFPLLLTQTSPNLSKQEHPKAYWGLMIFTFTMAAVSGFTADEMGKDAWKWFPNIGGKTGAVVSGALSNIGAALIFNLPQAILFVSRAINLCLSHNASDDVKQAIVLSSKVNGIAGTVQAMSAGNFGEVLNDSDMPQDEFKEILEDKMTEVEMSLLGEFYRPTLSIQA